MKNFSDLIKENDSLKSYSYVADVKIRGFVQAHNEGEAGELVDQEIDVLSQHTTIDSYEIETITETNAYMQQESKLVDNESIVENAISLGMNELNKHIKNMSDLQFAMFKEELLKTLSNLEK